MFDYNCCLRMFVGRPEHRSQGKGMMDLGAMIGGDSKSQQLREFGSAYGLLADVATTLCPADILSLVRRKEAGLSLSSSPRFRCCGACMLCFVLLLSLDPISFAL